MYLSLIMERDSLGMSGKEHECNDLKRVHAERCFTSLNDATPPMVKCRCSIPIADTCVDLQGDNDKLASIYANALVELAQAKNALDTVHADVDSLQVMRQYQCGQA